MTHFLGISTGSSSISAGSQLFFQNFQGFTRLVAKSFENLTWICSKCSKNHRNRKQKAQKPSIWSKNQIFQGFTLGPWRKVGENGLRKWQNWQKSEIFLRKSNFSRLHLMSVAKSCGIFQISSKISKIFFFRSKNLENLRGFLDPHQIFQENQGFVAFLCHNIFKFQAK